MSKRPRQKGKIYRGGKRARFVEQEGFTLLELVVTLVITGILAAVVGISMARSDQNAKKAAAAHAILADLRYTQEVAMSSRRQTRFSLTSSGYTAVWVDDGSYIRRSQATNGEPIHVSFSSKDFSGLSIVPGAAATVGFTYMGAPLIGGSPLTSGSDLIVATIGGSLAVKLVPNTGYSYIE